MKIITLKKVVTVNRGSDWKAYLSGRPTTWEAGNTEAEAIGKLQLEIARENPHYKLIKHNG